ALGGRLFEKDGDPARAFGELTRRTAEIQAGRVLPGFGPEAAAATPPESALSLARSALLGAAAGAISENDLAPLVAAAACRAPDTALAGAAALAQMGDDRALGALLQISRDPDSKLRRRAAGALAALGDAHAQKRLAWMLDDADADVRSAAYDALALVHKEAPAALIEAALRASQQDIR